MTVQTSREPPWTSFLKQIARVLPGFVLLGVAAVQAGSADTHADMILTGGRVYLASGWAQAVAVRGGLIVAVGSARSVARWRGPATRVIDLQGAAVFPGLNDSHAHPVLAGLERQQPCPVPARPVALVLDAIAACAKAAPGRWINTGPVANDLLGAGLTRVELDDVAPGTPVFVYANGFHAFVVNTRAMQLAGVGRATQPPPGGIIVRDAAGEPTGVMHDARAPFDRVQPPPDRMFAEQGTAWALNHLLEFGVTSVTDAAINPQFLQPYLDLADSGQLKPRVRLCSLWLPTIGIDAYVRLRESSHRERLTADCVKLFVDGDTGTSHTGALIEPYQLTDGTVTTERGLLPMNQEELSGTVARLDREGILVKFHAWGDAAVDAALTAIETTRNANGSSGRRHEIGHVVLARKKDLSRAKRVNAVLEFSPWLWFPPAGPYMMRDIGEPRMSRAWPVRDALEIGAFAIGGTDWPAAPGASPWAAIQTLVTRMEPASVESPGYLFGPAGSGGSEIFAPKQRISLSKAIALFTSMPAASSGARDAPGIIEMGRKADLIVLDRNPFDIPISEVHSITARITIVGGEIVHESNGTP